MKTIHLKTARVAGLNKDLSPKVERTTVKLDEGVNFLKFIKHLHLKNYLEKEPPTVTKVTKFEKGKHVEVDKEPFQKIVDDALSKAKLDSTIDYKRLSEKQAGEINDLKTVNQGFEERLKALEKGPEKTERELLVEKANSLGLEFPKNITNEKLLEKIQAKELS